VSSALDSGTTLRQMSARKNVEALSTAQIAVLRSVSAGKSNEDIATERGTTVRAVERMLGRMIDAAAIPTGPTARVQLARMYWGELNGR
jgi:DNA-binding NarL/FixJ family response regulator